MKSKASFLLGLFVPRGDKEVGRYTTPLRQRIFQIGSNVYIWCEIVAMEWLVQQVLKFLSSFPTTYNFLWFYLKATRDDEEMEYRAKYLAVLSLIDPELLCYWPSTVAAGAV
ncbi:hypothetical protein MKW98_027585 [Papaver atlanticum]|uniref:Cyclin C-terminal domain-containing protein n=1 Tax=Papaver atlanticum TaxID=357466 RepID=A0AAD4XN64_9MAGN|nr:hypothetical protein MKW98_027585 [Papaver atlanticum]